MIRNFLILFLAFTCFAGPLASAAGQGESDGARRGERGSAPEQGQPPRGGDAGDKGAGSSGRSDENNGNSEGRRNNRLSPEERRALRRQIDEAGNDIYRKRR